MADGEAWPEPTGRLTGQPLRRVDGPLKVTGGAKYAAEYTAPGLLHGHMVSCRITKGRILHIDTSAAEAVDGVVKVFTYKNRPHPASLNLAYQDQVGPPGHPIRPLYDEVIRHSDEPIALVVADKWENARDAAALIHVDYAVEEHITDLEAVKGQAYKPPRPRFGIKVPPPPWGDAESAYAASPVKVGVEYKVTPEIHNPMEMFACTCVREADGKFTVYDKTQGSQNTQQYLQRVHGIGPGRLRVVNNFVGGGFGSGLRPQHSAYLAVMASKALKRSVRVTLTRDQMFGLNYRPDTINQLHLGAGADGRLHAIKHHAIAATSAFEDHQEVVVNWSGLLYRCDNVSLTYHLAKVDTMSPSDMRAPGAAIGVYALESAMDELAYAVDVDPLELRRRNYVDFDQEGHKQFTSKALHACYDQGAEAFGWSKRPMAPRAMKQGRELVGWGVATGVWDAQMSPIPSRARAELTSEGMLTVYAATTDIGTGTYTIMTQLAGEALGLPPERVSARLGDSKFPLSPVEGGSWTAATVGSAVDAACTKLKKALLKAARSLEGHPLKGAKLDQLIFHDGRVSGPDGASVALIDLIAATGHPVLKETATVMPNLISAQKFVSYTHSAVFAEVRVDEELGVVRVTRVVNAVAGGRILNPKTARSQILGGVVMGISQALHEEAMTDHNLGRIVNHNLAEYHVAANADIEQIDVIFVDEKDEKVCPIGVKGLGEIGIVGTAAAVGNAIFHATGHRVRELPMTIEKVLGIV